MIGVLLHWTPLQAFLSGICLGIAIAAALVDHAASRRRRKP